jgi:hypothetical protein
MGSPAEYSLGGSVAVIMDAALARDGALAGATSLAEASRCFWKPRNLTPAGPASHRSRVSRVQQGRLE